MNTALAQGSLLGERLSGAAVSLGGPQSALQLDRGLPWGTIYCPLLRKYRVLPPLDFPVLLTRTCSQILIFIIFSLPLCCYSMLELEKTNKTFTTHKALLLTLCFSPCASVLSFFTCNLATSFSFLLLRLRLSLAHFKIFLHLKDVVNENWIANNYINFRVKTRLEGQN